MDAPANDLPGIAAGEAFPDGTPRTYEGRLRRDFDWLIEEALAGDGDPVSYADQLGQNVYANMQRARADIRAALAEMDALIGARTPLSEERLRAAVALVRGRLEWL